MRLEARLAGIVGQVVLLSGHFWKHLFAPPRRAPACFDVVGQRFELPRLGSEIEMILCVKTLGEAKLGYAGCREGAARVNP